MFLHWLGDSSRPTTKGEPAMRIGTCAKHPQEVHDVDGIRNPVCGVEPGDSMGSNELNVNFRDVVV